MMAMGKMLSRQFFKRYARASGKAPLGGNRSIDGSRRNYCGEVNEIFSVVGSAEE
jgi:hypothetical protein